jgi:hypothetical protein
VQSNIWSITQNLHKITVHTSPHTLSSLPLLSIPSSTPPQHSMHTEVPYKCTNIYHTKKTAPTYWWRKRRSRCN